jgi:mono/diheme cytochrome c family protein
MEWWSNDPPASLREALRAGVWSCWLSAIGYWLFFIMRSFICLSAVFVAFGFAGATAGRLTSPANEKAPAFRLFDQTDQPDGQKLFQTRCFVCHGRGGKGDGPSATGLAEKPQDLTDPTWQRATSDDRIRTVIQGGGIAIGKTGAMPPNPDLNQEQIQGLVSFVRSLAAH